MPESLLKEVEAGLIEVDQAIKVADARRMTVALERLDALVARSGGELDPRLAHFLARRSYGKALAFLGASGASRATGGPA